MTKQTPFTLNGRIDLDLSFGDKVICTPVYIKTDAHEQLLLLEGVCRQLDILQYHPDVKVWRGWTKQTGIFPRDKSTTTTLQPQTPPGEPMPKTSAPPPTGFTGDQPLGGEQMAEVPTVRVSLVQSL